MLRYGGSMPLSAALSYMLLCLIMEPNVANAAIACLTRASRSAVLLPMHITAVLVLVRLTSLGYFLCSVIRVISGVAPTRAGNATSPMPILTYSALPRLSVYSPPHVL